ASVSPRSDASCRRHPDPRDARLHGSAEAAMHTTMRSCFVLCTATLAGVVPSAAQQSLELSTFVGVHVPSTHVIGLYGFCPGDGKGMVTQNPASVVGARVTAWTGRRLGVDLSLDVSGPQATNVWGAKGSIMTGSARLLLGLTPRASSTSFYVAAGLGLVDHRGAAYSYGSSAGASVGPVVGAGGRFGLAATLALRATRGRPGDATSRPPARAARRRPPPSQAAARAARGPPGPPRREAGRRARGGRPLAGAGGGASGACPPAPRRKRNPVTSAPKW